MVKLCIIQSNRQVNGPMCALIIKHNNFPLPFASLSSLKAKYLDLLMIIPVSYLS